MTVKDLTDCVSGLGLKPQDEFAAKSVREFLPYVNEIVQSVASKTGLKALIAGGAVRDAAFGLWPNDIDVFVHTEGMENVEDDTLSFAADVYNEVVKTYGETELRRNENGNYDSKSKYVIYEGEDQVFWRKWVENNQRDRLQAVFDDGRIEEVPGWEEPYHCRLQFIARPDQVAEPIEFVKDFDYGLVRCWVNPESGELEYSPDFQRELREREIPVKDEKTDRRVGDFLYRLKDMKFKRTGFKRPQPTFTSTMTTTRTGFNQGFLNALDRLNDQPVAF